MLPIKSGLGGQCEIGQGAEALELLCTWVEALLLPVQASTSLHCLGKPTTTRVRAKNVLFPPIHDHLGLDGL